MIPALVRWRQAESRSWVASRPGKSRDGGGEGQGRGEEKPGGEEEGEEEGREREEIDFCVRRGTVLPAGVGKCEL